MADERERIFQDAVELLDLAEVSKIGNWARQTGTVVVQTQRKPDYRFERAIDLLSCLPTKRRGVALIFAKYCQPWMLEEYDGLIAEIEKAGIRAERAGWVGWTREIDGAVGFYVGRFWREVKRRRVLRAA